MKVVSIRMPANAPERIRAATGMEVSTLARLVLMRLLEQAEAGKARAANLGSQIDNITDKVIENGKQPN